MDRTAPTAPTAPAAEVVVAVAGEVVRPGLVRLLGPGGIKAAAVLSVVLGIEVVDMDGRRVDRVLVATIPDRGRD